MKATERRLLSTTIRCHRKISENICFALDNHRRQSMESILSETVPTFHLSLISPMKWGVLISSIYPVVITFDIFYWDLDLLPPTCLTASIRAHPIKPGRGGGKSIVHLLRYRI